MSHTMPSPALLFLSLINICLLLSLSSAVDPTVFYNFEVSYITASPLGVPQQVGFLDLSFPRYHFSCYFKFNILDGLCLLSHG